MTNSMIAESLERPYAPIHDNMKFLVENEIVKSVGQPNPNLVRIAGKPQKFYALIARNWSEILQPDVDEGPVQKKKIEVIQIVKELHRANKDLAEQRFESALAHVVASKESTSNEYTGRAVDRMLLEDYFVADKAATNTIRSIVDCLAKLFNSNEHKCDRKKLYNIIMRECSIRTKPPAKGLRGLDNWTPPFKKTYYEIKRILDAKPTAK